jgi:hypothetical protein
MSCSSCSPQNNEYGASPSVIQWKVVRGDTATLKIEFFTPDEVSKFDTTGWTYEATAYDTDGSVLNTLDVQAAPGYVLITAHPQMTEDWGSGYKSVVKELPFDLEVTIPGTPENKIWTPVLGNICVLGDVSPGGLGL